MGIWLAFTLVVSILKFALCRTFKNMEKGFTFFFLFPWLLPLLLLSFFFSLSPFPHCCFCRNRRKNTISKALFFLLTISGLSSGKCLLFIVGNCHWTEWTFIHVSSHLISSRSVLVCYLFVDTLDSRLYYKHSNYIPTWLTTDMPHLWFVYLKARWTATLQLLWWMRPLCLKHFTWPLSLLLLAKLTYIGCCSNTNL